MTADRTSSHEKHRVHLSLVAGESSGCFVAPARDGGRSKQGPAQLIYSLAGSHKRYCLASDSAEENKAEAALELPLRILLVTLPTSDPGSCRIRRRLTLGFSQR